MAEIYKPTFTDALDILSLGLTIINPFMVIITLLGIFFKYIDVGTSIRTNGYMLTLLFGSLIWQFLRGWTHYYGDNRWVDVSHHVVIVLLSSLVVYGQMDILKAVSFLRKTKVRITYLQYSYLFLGAMSLIGAGICVPWIDSFPPRWAFTIYIIFYTAHLMAIVLYEGYHFVYISVKLYIISKSFAQTSNLNPEIWKLQKKSYTFLFILVGMTLVSDWTAVILWQISSPVHSKDLSFISSHLASLHTIYVVLIFAQLGKVPLEKHTKDKANVYMFKSTTPT
ncbi:hypothetical protein BC833DRAFT_587560 [Globomyces pollinis-pini]|nr:hypothetical protein BC833DRAFT_587560 [Globomyces pollinis-pini]